MMVRIKTENREKILGQTRQALLNQAAEEFASLGYELANINTISVKAGFAKGTIYNYFPSKQDLLYALISSIAQEHLEYMQAGVLSIEEPAARMERFFQAGFDYVTQHLYRARTMFNAVNGSNQEHKEYCFNAYQPLFQFVERQILWPGIQQGIFHATELQTTAILLMTIYLGTASQIDALGSTWLSPKQVSQLVLNGL
jgi:AcrR family transcriptional regulator